MTIELKLFLLDIFVRKSVHTYSLQVYFICNANGAIRDFETFGPWGDETSKLVTEIGKRLTEVTGEKRVTSYLKQRISMAIQKGNCASVLATIPSDAGLKEIYL